MQTKEINELIDMLRSSLDANIITRKGYAEAADKMSPDARQVHIESWNAIISEQVKGFRSSFSSPCFYAIRSEADGLMNEMDGLKIPL